MLQLLGTDLTPVHGCTEHKRAGIIFRGHPAYRGSQGWFDWALFQWESAKGISLPGHIITFLLLSQTHLDQLEESEYIIGDEPGIFALIETL